MENSGFVKTCDEYVHSDLLCQSHRLQYKPKHCDQKLTNLFEKQFCS